MQDKAKNRHACTNNLNMCYYTEVSQFVFHLKTAITSS